MADSPKDQQHPQYKVDRQVVSQLLAGELTDYNLVELARMIIRYEGFPGRGISRPTLRKPWPVGSLPRPNCLPKPVPSTSRATFTKG